MSFLNDLFSFLLGKKTRFVLIPFFIIILLIAALLVVVGGSAWAPFVYAVF